MSAACSTCRYAADGRPPGVPTVGQTVLHCHRYPVAVLTIPAPGGVQITHAHPVVFPDDWCGEHVKKAAAP